MDPLVYPIIFRYDDMTVPSGNDFPKIWQVRFRGEREFDAIESIHPAARFHWIIDGNANLLEISLESKSREWLRPFRHVWRCVREHYSIEDGRELTIGELRGLIEGTRLDEEKSLTPALQEFLDGRDLGTTFTKSMFREFMRE
tara:strand:+ start:478 stop:906 length:429 start_codon:yes stop_codon:yes gene_type:complete